MKIEEDRDTTKCLKGTITILSYVLIAFKGSLLYPETRLFSLWHQQFLSQETGKNICALHPDNLTLQIEQFLLIVECSIYKLVIRRASIILHPHYKAHFFLMSHFSKKVWCNNSSAAFPSFVNDRAGRISTSSYVPCKLFTVQSLRQDACKLYCLKNRHN